MPESPPTSRLAHRALGSAQAVVDEIAAGDLVLAHMHAVLLRGAARDVERLLFRTACRAGDLATPANPYIYTHRGTDAEQDMRLVTDDELLEQVRYVDWAARHERNLDARPGWETAMRLATAEMRRRGIDENAWRAGMLEED